MTSDDVGARIEALKATEGRPRLAVIITTYNEEVNVEECIRSVIWADEILLVDSFSTDRTVELARTFPIRVEQREYFGSAAQKNWALDQVSQEWAFILDADERVPPELAEEILALLAAGPRADGYQVCRRNFLLGKEIRYSGWGTDKVTRLFRREKGRYPNRRVHADLAVDGTVPLLRHALVHYTYRSLEQYFPKLLNYGDWAAAQALREGRTAGWFEVAIRPLWRFFRMFILQGGFLDGLHGFVVCFLQAFATFLKYSRLWEFRIRLADGEELDLPAFDEDPSTWETPSESSPPV